MGKFTKIKIITLILGIFLALSLILTTNLNSNMGFSDKNSEYSDDTNQDNENLKILKISKPIYINDNNPSNNWSIAKDAGICTGNGTYSKPYVIEDLVIDGGGSGNCIWIENSNVYFRIENCTVYNSGSGYGAGIKLYNTDNGNLTNNSCSNNPYSGIYLSRSDNYSILGNIINNNWIGIILYDCNNNTVSGNNVSYGNLGICLENCDNTIISGNVANYNNRAIHLWYSDSIIISGNSLNYNQVYGIDLNYSNNNTLSGNIMNECGLAIIGSSLEELGSHDIDTTNLVNGKPLYYYTNEVNLRPYNFTNAGQVILVNCNDSLISNLDVSYSSMGILLYSCNNNTISGNTANNSGIILKYSNNNTVLGNTAKNNWIGITISNSKNNTISGNTANYNELGGISLSRSYYNNISGNNASYTNGIGISLHHSDKNDISGNTANYNVFGILLDSSDFNTISRNKFIGNDLQCIVETDCEGNIFKDNDCGEGDGRISGYNLIFLLGILSIVAILISKKLKK